jgi:hypothetical protein
MTLEAPPGAWCSADREIARLSRSEKTVRGASERVGKATHARNEHHGRSPSCQRDGLQPMAHSRKPPYQPVYPGRRPTAWLRSRNCPTMVSTSTTRDGCRAGRHSRGLPPPWRPLRRHRTKCSLGRGAGSALRIPLIRVPHPMARHRWLGTVLRGALCESALTAGPSQLRAGSDRPTGLRE